MGALNKIIKVHYEGIIDEFKAVGIDVSLDYEHLKNKWYEGGILYNAAMREGNVMGFVAILDGEPAVYIARNYRRQRIGSRILKSASPEIKEALKAVRVMEGNTPAEKFYKKNGYRKMGGRPRKVVKLGHTVYERKWKRSDNA